MKTGRAYRPCPSSLGGNAVKIKLLTSRAGIGFSQNAGEEIEVSTAEAEALMGRGQAVLVREQKIERAVKTRREKAVK